MRPLKTGKVNLLADGSVIFMEIIEYKNLVMLLMLLSMLNFIIGQLHAIQSEAQQYGGERTLLYKKNLRMSM